MEHEKSDMHHEAVMKLAAKSNAVDVSMQFSAYNREEKQSHYVSETFRVCPLLGEARPASM